MMRRFLCSIGYRADGWRLGRNLGARAIGADGARLTTRLRTLYERNGEPVTLIGISLGGIMARVAAHQSPEMVREVITVSSPYAGSPRATNVWRSFEIFTGDKIDATHVREMQALAALPLLMPETAIWSRSDGLVNGAICHSPGVRAIEVRSSHIGVRWRPEVLLAIATVLAESQ